MFEYRVVNHKRVLPDGQVDVWYQVEEVFFTSDDRPTQYAPASASGLTLHEARMDTQLMLEAFSKPVLYFDESTGTFVEPDRSKPLNM